MYLEVVTYPARVLAKPARRITGKEGLDLHAFFREMVKAMKEYDGIGLAAPQVGRSIRFLVAHDSLNGETRAFINPQIIGATAECTIGYEGCLSFPGVRGRVQRSVGIRLRYQDLNLVEHEEDFIDFYARVLQHEIDHLNGVLLIDRAIDGLEELSDDDEEEDEFVVVDQQEAGETVIEKMPKGE